MLHVHRSNRVERLADALAEQLATAPLSDPFAAEVVVVHSQGMERWLAQRLSQRLGAPTGEVAGVCANIEWPFPATLVRRVLAACDDGVHDRLDPWQVDRLVFPVLAALRELEVEPAFQGLRRYATADEPSARDEGDAGAIGRRRMGLARRIADTFDRYAIYRPWMARCWSAGRAVGPDPDTALDEDLAWQPRLWAAIQARVRAPSLAERFERARVELERRRDPLPELPARVCVFGLGTLPPAYLDLLSALARLHDVHLFLPSPSDAYWGEVRGRRARLAGARTGEEIDAILAGEDNPLLAAFGRLPRDFQVRLESGAGPDYVDGEGADFEDPATAVPTLLRRLQSDILHLHVRGGRDGPPRLPIAPDDDSIEVHACHGATRQVEALRDAILRRMEDPASTLEPRDIVIMTPDVETFAPIVASVFAAADPDAGVPMLPVSIADRSLGELNPVAAALDRVLALVHGRMPASGLLDLLRLEVVRARFGIEVDEIGRIERWATEAGARWGIDAAHRAEHGRPGDGTFTWRFALDRLVLGVALADEDDRSFAGVVPYDDIEGDAVDLLGRFDALCEALFAHVRGLARPRPLGAWIAALTEVLDGLIAVPEPRAWQLQQVRDVLEELGARAHGPEGEPFPIPLELDAVRLLLAGAFRRPPRAIGHQTGAITFCAMVPMRSIPHRVVCLLGLDDGAFPRAEPVSGLDLVSRHPRIGDRSARQEDHFLFLEALLAAREALLVTHAGRDPRTNEVLAPAIPVGQLLDAIDAGFLPPPGATKARAHVLIDHPLHAFSPRNFLAGPAGGAAAAPRSHDRRLLAAARRWLEPRVEPPPFLSAPLPPAPAEEGDVLALADLVAFWQHPVRGLVQGRLGLSLHEDREAAGDQDLFELDGLAQWAVRDRLVRSRLAGADLEAARAALRGRGQIPVGAPGELALAGAAELAREAVTAVSEWRTGPVRTVPVEVVVSGRRVVGSIGSVYGSAVVGIQVGVLKPKHKLARWIELLALCACQPEVDWEVVVVARAAAMWRIGPLPVAGRRAQARRLLGRLVELEAVGRTRILPFFPAVALARAKASRAGKDPGRAGNAAWRKERGRGDDSWNTQALGDVAVSDLAVDHDELAALAEELFSPMLAVQHEEGES
jgi:exodeoxyribonuclease V gamma subunit